MGIVKKLLGKRREVDIPLHHTVAGAVVMARVNGGVYYGDLLPAYKREWPRNTYLQKRLRYLRVQEAA
jgi:hypothetical protein